MTAPTVVIPGDQEDWRGRLRAVAEVVDRGDRAEEAIAAVDDRIADLRARLESLGLDTALFARPYFDGVYVVRADFPGRLLQELGFALTDEVDTQTTEARIEASLKELGLLDADVVFLGLRDDDENRAFRDALESNPLYRSLAVVQAGRVYSVDSDQWNAGSVAGVGACLDDVERALLA